MIALSIVLGLVYLAHFMYSNLYAIVMNYASKQTINIATLIIKEAIGQSELVSFNVEDIIHFEENDKGYVSSVYINTPELNRLLLQLDLKIKPVTTQNSIVIPPTKCHNVRVPWRLSKII